MTPTTTRHPLALTAIVPLERLAPEGPRLSEAQARLIALLPVLGACAILTGVVATPDVAVGHEEPARGWR